MPSDSSALGVLRDVFGYPAFRGEQAEIIGHVASGGDALVLMPTGGGKSLCYQIPALLRPGCAVVVSPLIALMQDQVDALTQLGVKAACLNSTLDWREAQAVELRRLSDAAALAARNGIEGHAGHGLTYANVAPIAAIPQVRELNIGHFLIGEALFVGLATSVQQMRAAMDAAR